MQLTFYGGAGKVTGSNFLIESGNGKIIVDCGIEQGADFCEECVYGPFPYDAKTIAALVITHAHLDHVGRAPKLVRDGFRGKVFMTPPTRDLAELILRDSINILAETAREKGVAPLYEAADVETFLALIEPLDYHVAKEVSSSLSVYLRNTGHILGSASVRITASDGATVALTGDIGNSPSPLLPDWEPVPDADALVMESVYGDRVHPAQQRRTEILVEVLKRAIERGGAILIPAFSMERTQLMLYELSNFFAAGTLPKIPVFLDSPLAINVTEIYGKWGPTYFKPQAQDEMKREKSLFEFPFLTKTLSREESGKIADTPNPKIIIAGAGMSHGGRIGRHEARYLPDPKSTLIIVGYQAPGSPGRLMQEGAPSVRLPAQAGLNGQEVALRAKVEILEGWSAHADRDELLQFAEACLSAPSSAKATKGAAKLKVIFTALGEPAAERYLAQRIHDYLGARAIVPEYGQTWEVTKDSVTRV
ncbi:MBL fold metallo-hydrolase [Candidatus Kaiserbacteria bacterium]|nr:MBL fold metallo-hydrolase [Candidatus Kaiserbacteria bacterium]